MSNPTKLVLLLTFLLSVNGKVQGQFYKEFDTQLPKEVALIKKAGFRRMIRKEVLNDGKEEQVREEFYNESGQLIRFEQIIDAKYSIKATYSYHSNGTIKTVLYRHDMAIRGPTYNITFNEHGIPVKGSWSVNRIRRKQEKGFTIVFDYKEKERILLGYEIKEDGGDTVYRSTTFYNSQNKISEWVRTDMKNDTFGWQRFVYDSFGMPVLKVGSLNHRYNFQDKWTSTGIYDSTSYSYTYDEAVNVTSETKTQYGVDIKSRKATLRYIPKTVRVYNNVGQCLDLTLFFESEDKSLLIPRYSCITTLDEYGLPVVTTYRLLGEEQVKRSDKNYYFKN